MRSSSAKSFFFSVKGAALMSELRACDSHSEYTATKAVSIDSTEDPCLESIEIKVRIAEAAISMARMILKHEKAR